MSDGSATVTDVLSAVAFVPSPPLLLPALAGAATDEIADLRAAVDAAGEFLRDHADRWIAVGTGTETVEAPPTARGTYAGFGVDTVVDLGPDATGEPDRDLPLAALTAGWLRGRILPDASLPVCIGAASSTPRECAQLAARWASTLADDSGRWGVLVVGDGATTLTDKAPGAFDERAEEVQRAADDALATGDTAALVELDAELCAELGVGGRAAWQIAAAMVGDRTVSNPTTLYRGAPYGVGYFVGTWLL